MCEGNIIKYSVIHFTGSESRSLCPSSAYASSVLDVMATGISEHVFGIGLSCNDA